MSKLFNMIIVTLILSFIIGIFFTNTYSPTSPESIFIEALLSTIVVGIFVILAVLIVSKIIGKINQIVRKKPPAPKNSVTNFIMNNYGYGIVFITSALFFNVVLNGLGITGILYFVLFTFFCELMVVLYKWTWEKYLNVFSIFTTAVWGAWIGVSWGMNLILLIFLGFVVYDIIAVFRTKIMKNLVIRVLSARSVPPMFLTDMDIVNLRARIRGEADPKKVPVKGHLLGNGDMIFGSAFAVGGLIYFNNFLAGSILVLGCIMGIWLNYYIVEKRKVGLPALPIIFASQFGFYLFFITGNILPIVVSPIIAFVFIDKLAIKQAKKKEKLESLSK